MLGWVFRGMGTPKIERVAPGVTVTTYPRCCRVRIVETLPWLCVSLAGAMLVAVGVQSYVDDGADQNTVLGGFVVATLVLRLLAIKLGPTGPKYSGKGHGVSVYAKAVEPAEPGRTAIYGSVTKLVDHGVTTLYAALHYVVSCAAGADAMRL